MKPGQSLEIRLVDSKGQPAHLSNIVVEVHFFTRGNYRFGFKVGRTDESGHLSTSYSEIEALRGRDAEENLMDYNTRLDDCDPTVEIVVPSERELREQANNAQRIYQTLPDWAEIWPSNARANAAEASVQLVGQIVFVQVTCSQ